eukprot:14998558-Heterocapsa_arctica.AAC.1
MLPGDIEVWEAMPVPAGWRVLPKNTIVCSRIGIGVVALAGGDYDGDQVAVCACRLLLKILDLTTDGQQHPTLQAAAKDVSNILCPPHMEMDGLIDELFELSSPPAQPGVVDEQQVLKVRVGASALEILIVESAPRLSTMVEQAIRGDGNCLFRSVAWATTGSQDSHLALRHAVVSKVMEDPFYAPFLDLDTSMETWVQDMSRSGVDGDHLVMVALAQIIGQPIVVWRNGCVSWPTMVSIPHAMVDFDPCRDSVLYVLLTESHLGQHRVDKSSDASGSFRGHYT